jgi:heme oxygenase
MDSQLLSARAPGVRETLRAATHARHAAVADTAPMRRLLATDYSLQEYRLHILRLLGFFEPLEHAVAFAVGPDSGRHLFRRAPALRMDLAASGYSQRDIEAAARCTTLPHVTAEGASGCLYVLLGSMLGGRMIAQHLRRVLGGQVSLQFYGAGAGESDERWTSFCHDLELQPGVNVRALCGAACATFDAYALWLQDGCRDGRHAIAG